MASLEDQKVDLSTVDKEKLEEFAEAYCAHPEFDPDTGLCTGGTEWCSECTLEANQPDPKAVGSLLLLAIPYTMARLLYAVFGFLPFIFGYRRATIVRDGRAFTRFVRRRR